MIYVYIFALIVGGLLLGASLILGAASDHDVHIDHGAPTPAASGDPQGIESILLSILSARFWTFFTAFFGLTGVLLDGFGLVGSVLAGVLAVGVGLFAGFFATWLVRLMTVETSNSAVLEGDFAGKTGRVLVGFQTGGVGKVRVEVKGSTIDLVCTGMDEGSYALHEEVLIVEMDGPRARIARTQPIA